MTDTAATQPALPLIETKLHPPAARAGSVSRRPIVSRLRASACPMVTITAPPGYGKTTLAAQWAELDDRPFAWLTADRRDNDPVVLLSYLTTALASCGVVDGPTADDLTSLRASIWSTLVPRVGAAVSESTPFVMVLDDVHAIENRESLDVLDVVARHLPPGSQVALVGRHEPAFVARLRAEGRLFEIGTEDLALTARDARRLMREVDVEISDAEVDELNRHVEGWPAGLYLAALARTSGSPKSETVAGLVGTDRYVADYFRSELIATLGPETIEFLTRTSVLDTMSPALCDAVLERRGSARLLQSIEESNLFLVPLDRNRTTYRYHHVFRELLRDELERREPDLVGELSARAAGWCMTNGAPEAAIDYAYAAGDVAHATQLMASLAMPVYYSGRVATLERWFERLEQDGLIAADPAIPVFATWVHALRARPEDAQRCLTLCESLPETSRPMPDGTLTIRPWLVLARAVMCTQGVAEMQADAESGLAGLAPASLWRPTGFLLVGYARLLAGDAEEADLYLNSAAAHAAELGATDTYSLATAQRALLAAEQGDHDLADELSAQATATMEAAGLDEYMTSAIPLVASARAALRQGDGNAAQRFLAHAKRVTPWLSYAIPWFAVLAWLEIGRVHRALADGGGVATALAEIDAVRKHRPDLGILTEQADDLRREIETMPKPEGRWSSSLTAAELRLLPLLATHLSFREIGERLFVTRNTVKTQAISVYRKLGVSSRSEAIQRAAELGLVDAAAVPSARLLAPSDS